MHFSHAVSILIYTLPRAKREREVESKIVPTCSRFSETPYQVSSSILEKFVCLSLRPWKQDSSLMMLEGCKEKQQRKLSPVVWFQIFFYIAKLPQDNSTPQPLLGAPEEFGTTPAAASLHTLHNWKYPTCAVNWIERQSCFLKKRSLLPIHGVHILAALGEVSLFYSIMWAKSQFCMDSSWKKLLLMYAINAIFHVKQHPWQHLHYIP